MTADQIIDNIGGTDKCAALCELDKSSVSKWRKRGIPHHWVKYLKLKRPKAFQPAVKK